MGTTTLALRQHATHSCPATHSLEGELEEAVVRVGVRCLARGQYFAGTQCPVMLLFLTYIHSDIVIPMDLVQ